MPSINIDEETFRLLNGTAQWSGRSVADLVQRAVQRFYSKAADHAESEDRTAKRDEQREGLAVPIFMRYRHEETRAILHPGTGEVRITTGPLAEKSFGTPSGAAQAVVAHFAPNLNKTQRNGWRSWKLVENGALIETVRRR
jgi:hypothetical protein